MCEEQMEKDVSERKKHISEFSLDMEQHTLRKFELLQDELKTINADRHQSEKEPATHEAIMKAQQMSKLCANLDTLHDSLCGVAGSMVKVVKTCCDNEVEPNAPDTVVGSGAGATPVRTSVKPSFQFSGPPKVAFN